MRPKRARRAAQNHTWRSPPRSERRLAALERGAARCAATQGDPWRRPVATTRSTTAGRTPSSRCAGMPPSRDDRAFRPRRTRRRGTGICPTSARRGERLAERHARGAIRSGLCALQAAYRDAARLSHRASAEVLTCCASSTSYAARARARPRRLAQRLETGAAERASWSASMPMLAAQDDAQVEAAAGATRGRGRARSADAAFQPPLSRLVMPGLIGAAERRGAPLALALIDLDHFKLVNDRHGHPAGDLVLREIGRVLPMSLRPVRRRLRYGGEEFCVVLPDADGRARKKRSRASPRACAICASTWDGEHARRLHFSAGVAVLGRHGNAFARPARVRRSRAVRREGDRPQPRSSSRLRRRPIAALTTLRRAASVELRRGVAPCRVLESSI